MMNTRQKKILLWVIGTGFLASSVTFCAFGLQTRTLPDIGQTTFKVNRLDNHTQNKRTPMAPLSAYEPVWNRPLRSVKTREVVAAPQAPKAQPTITPPNIKVIGTVVEDDNCFAIIEANRGEQELLGVGDILNNEIQILTVELEKVKVMYHSKEFELEAPREKED